jgi:hypothetical protein
LKTIIRVKEGSKDVDEANSANKLDQTAIEKDGQGKGIRACNKGETRCREPAHRFKVRVCEEVKWVGARKHVVPYKGYHEHHRKNRERHEKEPERRFVIQLFPLAVRVENEASAKRQETRSDEAAYRLKFTVLQPNRDGQD